MKRDCRVQHVDKESHNIDGILNELLCTDCVLDADKGDRGNARERD